MTEKRQPLRWRRAPSDGERYRTTLVYELRRGETVLARAQTCNGGWFWYGMGRNTAGQPATLDQVKAHASKCARDAALTAGDRDD
jgi:hypothetical protein